MLHQLAARSVIRDWQDGSLSESRTEHEIVQKKLKSYVINLSIEHSIVSPFTSFIAIEERSKVSVVRSYILIIAVSFLFFCYFSERQRLK